MAGENESERVRQAVSERYAAAARAVQQRTGSGCGCSSGDCCDLSSAVYDPAYLREVPAQAALASMGCGNPLLLADLKPGEVVLDLGSGGGIDVLLSARRVAPTGKAYGLDMTDEMLDLARSNAARAGVTNVEFLKGQIEAIPLPDASVDVVISNCVINLSPDKDAVLAEAYRVLRPGGRFAVADIVVLGPTLPPALRQSLALWADCVAGALGEQEYRDKLAAAGFQEVDIQVLSGTGGLGADCCCAPAELRLDPETRIASAFIRARKAARPSPARPGPPHPPPPSPSAAKGHG